MMTTAVKERTLDEILTNPKKPMTEKLVEAEQLIKNSEHVYDFGLGTVKETMVMSGKNWLASHLYIKEVTTYGFILQAVVYKQSLVERAVTNDEGEEIKPASYDYELNRVYELEYSLRDKYTRLLKNGSPLKFSENNIKNMFSGQEGVIQKLDSCCNTEMYSSMYDVFSCIGNESVPQVARFLVRFMQLNVVELIYKSGVPIPFAKDFARDQARKLEKGNGWYGSPEPNANWVDCTATAPAKVLDIPKSLFKIICQGNVSFSRYVSMHRAIERAESVGFEEEPREEWNRELRMYIKPEEDEAIVQKRKKYNEKCLKRNKQGIIRACGALYHLFTFAVELDSEYGIEKASNLASHEFEDMLYREVVPTRVNSLQNNSAVCIAFSLGLELNRVARYMYYQLHVEQGFTDGYYNATYHDYLRMMRQLEIADKGNYPKSLKTVHDVAEMNTRMIKDKELADNFAEQVKHYREWEDVKVRGSKYIMRAPESIDDLAKEGSSLSHCVFSYARSVALGETTIMFLRTKACPDDSLVTVEIKYSPSRECYRIVQARGHSNRALTTAENEFLEKWCKKSENVERK